MARVLKGRYFCHQDIMEVEIGSNPSSIWRALMWSRSLLAKGLCWKVGDGARINTFEDIWLPGPRTCLAPIPDYASFSKVKSLMVQGSWNVPLIQQIFSPLISQKITSIPITLTNRKDARFWKYDQKGKYSVRDGYKAAQGLYDQPSSCSAPFKKDWWKFLWSLSIPPKVRIFWWRALNNIIHTEQNLLAHHVPVTRRCPLCQYNWNTSSHALFSCPAVKSCLKSSWIWSSLKQLRHLDVFDIFLGMKEELSKLDFELFVMRTWATWNERLRFLHDCHGKAQVLDADWCKNLLRGYRAARDSVTSGSKSPLISSPSTCCAVGGVIRDHEGQPILAFGELIDKVQSVTLAEIFAIQVGLIVARQHNIQIHHITSDSLLAVQTVTRPEEDLSYAGSIAADISILMEALESPHLTHVRRSANRVAHSVAAFAFHPPLSLFGSMDPFLCG
ncbi:uncharacterized protein LOC142504368 [Primulina tabacum]|uniref:uncharacterized protein LOC142504368 n=1 Tax=Primulina tabacum TaxID=48773 RepID=UPI003F5A10AC